MFRHELPSEGPLSSQFQRGGGRALRRSQPRGRRRDDRHDPRLAGSAGSQRDRPSAQQHWRTRSAARDILEQLCGVFLKGRMRASCVKGRCRRGNRNQSSAHARLQEPGLSESDDCSADTPVDSLCEPCRAHFAALARVSRQAGHRALSTSIPAWCAGWITTRVRPSSSPPEAGLRSTEHRRGGRPRTTTELVEALGGPATPAGRLRGGRRGVWCWRWGRTPAPSPAPISSSRATAKVSGARR